MVKTVRDNEYYLIKKGRFFVPINGGTAFKTHEGNKFYWLKGETYAEYLIRIINTINL